VIGTFWKDFGGDGSPVRKSKGREGGKVSGEGVKTDHFTSMQVPLVMKNNSSLRSPSLITTSFGLSQRGETGTVMRWGREDIFLQCVTYRKT
jgi:hypothetical protein